MRIHRTQSYYFLRRYFFSVITVVGIRKEIHMSYRDPSDLPEAQTDHYDKNQKEAFLKAFDDVFDRNSESRAFAVGQHAAKCAGKREGAASGVSAGRVVQLDQTKLRSAGVLRSS